MFPVSESSKIFIDNSAQGVSPATAAKTNSPSSLTSYSQAASSSSSGFLSDLCTKVGNFFKWLFHSIFFCFGKSEGGPASTNTNDASPASTANQPTSNSSVAQNPTSSSTWTTGFNPIRSLVSGYVKGHGESWIKNHSFRQRGGDANFTMTIFIDDQALVSSSLSAHIALKDVLQKLDQSPFPEVPSTLRATFGFESSLEMRIEGLTFTIGQNKNVFYGISSEYVDKTVAIPKQLVSLIT